MQTYNKVKKEREPMQVVKDATAPFVTQKMAQKANPTLTGSFTGGSNVQSVVPAVSSQVNKSGKPYNPNINYTQESINAAKNGNLAGAKYYENMHNIKDSDMDLGWGASGIWNYLDSKGLGEKREAKYNEIQNYFDNDFEYDFQNDAVYQSILRQKEKEADKAYNDGYAQLSRAFDGDIPVNMINKLLTTKSEITDQADSYIPQLRQMAYEMYVDKGNQLYNQYGLLDAMADEDYNKFLTDRDFMAQGVRDAYNNKIDAERYAEDVAYRNAVFDYEKEWNQLNFDNKNYWNQTYLDNDNERWQQEFDEGVKQYNETMGLKRYNATKPSRSQSSSNKSTTTTKDYVNLALKLLDSGECVDIDDAMKKAKKTYDKYN